MAQVGRISGPLLEANLLRQGIASNTQANLTFKNTSSDTSLLKIDVVNGRIGVDKDNPANELQISNTVSTTDLLSTTANIANFDIYNDTIEATNNIYISAQNEVILSNLQTDQFYLTDNRISTTNTNANIELDPNGTGTVEVQANLNTYGNLHATSNITLDGNIIFGDTGDDSTALTDTVTFDADIESNIIPDATDSYYIGGVTRRWNDISTRLVNGQLVGVGAVTVAGIDLTLRPGNILYVSKNGNDTNVGDHPSGALLTIEEALSRTDASTDGPVTIKIMSGEYEENLPLVVPNRVSIIGQEIRNVIIKPAAGSESRDVFHLDDSTLISNLTIKDYQYDSVNNTGYAFRFAPNAVITNRSPYIQDITVITTGSVTSASDPRGFAQGDAGKGAWIDGAELDSSSIEASMLFHSATFITPGVDAITMTNGVRVEWLNSFSYFANRGLYAINGSTGRTSYDGSTTVYGAEVRSIGSANVYGNYGAVADGSDTLMYLIQHNFGYIGAGKFSDNNESRAIQSQEVTELNNGQIRFVTTDHTGNFRIGDNFFVDFETGNTTLNINALDVDQFDEILIRSGANSTLIGPGTIDFSSFRITENNFITTTGDLNVAANTGVINLQDNTNIVGNLDVSGNLTYDGALNIKGDNTSDSIVFNVEFEQDFNPHQHQNFTLGSFTKRWLSAYLDRLESSDVSVYDNIITTSASNADLELRANSSGIINVPSNDVTFSQTLTVNGVANLQNTNITGTVTHIGDTTQTGNYTISGEISNGNISIEDNFITTTDTNSDLELRASSTGEILIPNNVQIDNNFNLTNTGIFNNVTIQGTLDVAGVLNLTGDFSSNTLDVGGSLTANSAAQFEEILINGNFITTTSTNAPLELRTAGTGTVNLQDTVNVTNNLTASDTTATNANITLNATTDNANIGNVEVNDNYIETTNVDGNLILSADRNVVVTGTDVNLAQDLTVQGATDLQSTTVTGTITHVGDTTQTGNAIVNGEFTNGNLYIEDNFVTTLGVNQDLDLRADSNVIVPSNDVQINNNLTVGSTTNLQSLDITGSLTHAGAYNQTGNYTIGGELTVDNVYVEDNFITTTSGNLTLGAAGTGTIFVSSNNVSITNNLDVDSVTNLDVTNIDGTLTHTGDRTHTGNHTIGGELTVDNVYIEDNFITTTSGNLNLGATGDINVNANNVEIAQDLTVSGLTSLQGTLVTGNITHIGAYNQTGNLDIAGEISNGDIKIEDNFVTTTQPNSNLELRASGTGEILVPNNNVQIDNNLTVSTDTNLQSTTISGLLTQTGNRVQTGDYDIAGELTVDNIYVEDNFITTTLGNLTLRATGDINVDANDVEIAQDLTVNGATSLQGTAITGIVTHTGNRTQTGNLDIAGEISNGNILIEDNFISTTNTNSDLELRASGTGEVVIDPSDTVTIDNNLFVGGTLDYQGFLTINGDVALLGNTQDGSLTVTNDFDVTGTLDISSQAQFEDIRIEDNFITTTQSNSNLELRASGTGEVLVPNSGVQVNNGLFAASISTGDINVNNDLVLDELAITDSNIEINENYITTKISNSDLELRAAGNVVVRENTIAEQNLTVNGDTNLQGTTINGTLTHSGNRVQTANYTATNLTVTQVLDVGSSTQFEEILIDDNVITTTSTNSDLELRASGTGQIIFNKSVNVTKDLTVNELTAQNISVSGTIAIEDFEASNNLTFYDNVITTTESNSNLELRHAGNGSVFLENVGVTQSSISTRAPIDSSDLEYNNGAIIDLVGAGSNFFSREVTVNGVRIVAAGTVGGQTAVPDAFVEKVARMFELFTDPNGAGINEAAQRTLIKTLSGDAGTYHAAQGPTLQRVARGAGSDYTPNFLTDAGIASYNLSPLFDTHVANDMVWYLNSTGDGYGDGEIDAQEVIEHVFHTLHMHGLDAVSLKMYPFISADWATGPLYAAMEEAYDGGFWDPSGYGGANFKTDGDAFEVAAKEYLYLLNFAMFEYTGLWDGDSLAPEWTDTVRTSSQIQTNLPLGYALFNSYIAPVISKPSIATINSIFGDGNTPAQDDPSLAGVSGYVVSTSDTVSSITLAPTQDLIISSTAALQIPSGPIDDNATLGDIRFNTDDNVFEGITQSQAKVTFNGVFSDDRQTSVTADLNSNNIRMTINGSSDDSSAVEVGITGQALTATALQVGDIFINNNAVITNQSNSDLELRANGTGDLDFGDIKFKGNLIKDAGNSVVVKQTGFGTTKFGGSVGVVIPHGTTSERPAGLGQPNPQIGDSRWNTTTGVLETWTGTEYLSAAGNQAAISRQEFDDLLLEFTLIFG